MPRLASFFLLFAALTIGAFAQTAADLWNAYQADPDGHTNIPNNSYAGFMRGEFPVPDVPQVADVTDFGAQATPGFDNTAAFQAALDDAGAQGGGAVYVPPGTYEFEGFIMIRDSGVVLRGAGTESDVGTGAATVLDFKNNLEDLITYRGTPFDPWSWTGGHIWISPDEDLFIHQHRGLDTFQFSPWNLAYDDHLVGGNYNGNDPHPWEYMRRAKKLAGIVGEYERGEKSIQLDDASAISAGDLIVLHWQLDSSYTLPQELADYEAWTLQNWDEAGTHDWIKPGLYNRYQWPVEVASVSGNTLTLRQPLRLAIKDGSTDGIDWDCEVRAMGNHLRRVGVEHLTVRGHNRINYIAGAPLNYDVDFARDGSFDASAWQLSNATVASAGAGGDFGYAAELTQSAPDGSMSIVLDGLDNWGRIYVTGRARLGTASSYDISVDGVTNQLNLVNTGSLSNTEWETFAIYAKNDGDSTMTLEFKITGGTADNGKTLLVDNLVIYPSIEGWREQFSGGYTAVHMGRVVNGWVRNVETYDQHLSVVSAASKHLTISDIEIRNETNRSVHNLINSRVESSDNLIEGIRFYVPPEKHGGMRGHMGLLAEWFTSGNVYKNSVMEHGCFDYHRAVPFDVIHTNQTLTNNNAEQGGNAKGGPALGRRAVHWNMDVDVGNWVNMPYMMPNGALVGVRGPISYSHPEDRGVTDGDKGCLIVEPDTTPAITDLHQAQLDLRLQGENAAAEVTWPAHGAQIPRERNIPIRVRGVDHNGSGISSLRLFANGNEIASDTDLDGLIDYEWTDAPEGAHVLHAEIVSGGETIVSNRVTFFYGGDRVRIDDSDPRILYGGGMAPYDIKAMNIEDLDYQSGDAYLDTVHRSSSYFSPQGSFELTFTGVQLDVFAADVFDPDGSSGQNPICEVYLNDMSTPHMVFELKHRKLLHRKVYSTGLLPHGEHTLRFNIIENDSQATYADMPEGRGYFYLDYVEVLETTPQGANHIPTFASTPEATASVNAPYSYTVVTEDADGGSPSLSAASLPAWLSFTDNGDGTGVLSGTPTATETVTISLVASDGTDSRTQAFSLEVEPEQQAPVFDSTPLTETFTGFNYSYSIQTSDVNNDDLSIAAVDLPAWLSLSDNGDGTATLSGLTPVTPNSYSIQLRVSDGSFTVSQDFSLNVQQYVNLPPQFTSEPAVAVFTGEAYSTTLQATDPNGDAVSFSVGQHALPDWLTLVDNGDGSLVLSGTAPSAAGDAIVSIDATDGSTVERLLFVLSVVEPQMVTSDLYFSVNFRNGQTSNSLDPGEVAGADGFAAASWNNMGTGSSLGTLLGSNGVDYSDQLSLSVSGKKSKTDAASSATPDAKLMTVQSGAENVQIQVAGLSQIYGSGYDAVVYFANRNDKSGSAGTLQISDGSTSYSADTRQWDGSYSRVTSLAGETAQSGTHVVFEGLSQDSLSLTSTTSDNDWVFGLTGFQLKGQAEFYQNRDPEITSTAPTSVVLNETYSYTLQASDPDGDSLSIRRVESSWPAWLSFQDNGDGTASVSGTPTLPEHVAARSIVLYVKDGQGGVAQERFELQVQGSAGNTPPRFDSQPPTTAEALTQFQYTLLARDPEGASMTLEAEALPSWLSFTDHGDGSGTLSGYSEAPHTVHTIKLKASDGTDTAWQIFDLAVTEPQHSLFDLQAASWLGGSGDAEAVRGAGIQATGHIVLASNLGDATPPATSEFTLLGGGSGALVRLTPDGRRALSVTRLAAAVYDLALDDAGNLYLAAGYDGVIKLNPKGDTVLWQHLDGSFVYRVDASGDGHCVALVPGDAGSERDNKAGAGTIHLFANDAAGTPTNSFAGKHNTLDVAIDGDSQTIIYIGWYNVLTWTFDLGPYTPVDIPYMQAVPYLYDGGVNHPRKWRAYEWSGEVWLDEANRIPNPRWINYPFDTSESNMEIGSDGRTYPSTFFTSNMADTRGYRVSIGEDGKLYALFEADGGNHPLKKDPFTLGEHSPALSTSDGQIVGGDAFHAFYQTSTAPKPVFTRSDPATGVLERAQQFTPRRSNGDDNTCLINQGAIAADADGRVYIGGMSYYGLPIPGNAQWGGERAGEIALNPLADDAYAGGAWLLVYNPDYSLRAFTARLGGGYTHAIAVGTPAGAQQPSLVWGGEASRTPAADSLDTLHTVHPLQPAKGGGAADGFFAVSAQPLVPGQPTFLSSPPADTLQLGETFSYHLRAVDPEDDAISFIASQKPTWLTLSDYGDGTAVLEGTADSAGTFDVELVASDGAEQSTQLFQIDVSNGMTYSSWIGGYGLGGTNEAPGDDADGDGLANILEYALVLDALSDDAYLGQPTIGPAGAGQIVLTHRLRAGLSDVTILYQQATDPGGPWNTVSGGEIIDTDQGGFIERQRRIPMVDDRAFFRIQINY